MLLCQQHQTDKQMSLAPSKMLMALVTPLNSTLKYTFSHYQQYPNVCLQPWLFSWLCGLCVGIAPFAFLLFDHVVGVAVTDSAMLLANIAVQHSIL